MDQKNNISIFSRKNRKRKIEANTPPQATGNLTQRTDSIGVYIENKIDGVLDQESKNPDFIECPKCHHQTPETALTCPNCHHPVRSHLKQMLSEDTWKNNRKAWLIIGIAAASVLYFSIKLSSPIGKMLSELSIATLVVGILIRKFQLMYWKEKGFITEDGFWVIESQYIRDLAQQMKRALHRSGK